MYRHHELGLGRVLVHAAGMASPTAIETCCMAPGCPGVPRGQGFYYSMRVPRMGYLPAPTSALTVTVASRKGRRSPCARAGSEISIASVIGVSPPS